MIAQRTSTLKRNTLWMSVGQALRLIVQALYFTVIARSLGVANYGAFVGVVALVAIFYPFGAAGRGNLLVKNVAQQPDSFREMWGLALATCFGSGSILLCILLAISHYALPSTIPTLLILLVGLSDIIGLNVIVISGQAFQAFEQLRWTAILNVLISSFRLLGALLLCSRYPSPTPLQWGYVYFASSAAVALISWCLVSMKLGRAVYSLPNSWREVRDGLYFSIGTSAQTIYNDIDKTMLAKLSTLQAAGIYGAAYRLVDVSFSPITALLNAAYPNFFKAGKNGILSSWGYGRPHMLRAVAYGAGVCALLLACANVVPFILGPQYASTTEALRWLAPLPILKALHYFLSDSLTGAGYQWLRSIVQAAVAVFNVLINIWLIRSYSWRGAAWASILSDGLLALGVYIAIRFAIRREQALGAGSTEPFPVRV